MTTATKIETKYSQKPWGDLRVLAQSRGVRTNKRKRGEIEAELVGQDEALTHETPRPTPTNEELNERRDAILQQQRAVVDTGVSRATSKRFNKVYTNETGAPLRNALRIVDEDNNCVCTVYGFGRRDGIGGDRKVIDFESNADKIITALSG